MMVTLAPEEKITLKELKSDVKPIWCPGCGDFGVLSSVMKAIVDKQLDPAHVAVISGIGCSGRFPAFLNAYGFHGVHGRALPIATGLKATRPDLTVLVVGGDGDAFSIGGGHLPHAARRNIDLTYVVMDNEIYGLTKGQPSATSPADILRLSTSGDRKGNRKGSLGLLETHRTEESLNPMAMLLAYNASFVARAFSGQPRQLTDLIVQGIEHPGFAFIQVMSPCVTFYNTYSHYRDAVTALPEDYDPSDRGAALNLALDTTKLYTGVFYREFRETFDERLERMPVSDGDHLEQLLERFTVTGRGGDG
jgi:2-oxoglutarate ferredoxin oxidoreductase subunit beta